MPYGQIPGLDSCRIPAQKAKNFPKVFKETSRILRVTGRLEGREMRVTGMPPFISCPSYPFNILKVAALPGNKGKVCSLPGITGCSESPTRPGSEGRTREDRRPGMLTIKPRFFLSFGSIARAKRNRPRSTPIPRGGGKPETFGQIRFRPCETEFAASITEELRGSAFSGLFLSAHGRARPPL